MLQKLMAGQQVAQRLLPRINGERKLTNYLHLAELLQEASESRPGTDCLVRWFSMQRRNPEKAGDSQQLRLESDENLVRIVTVHKAKGLEYPVIFLPFIWSCRTRKTDEILLFHRPDTLEHVADLGTGEQEHYLQAERERLAEDLRLLYVAVTRARYCCYFCWGRIRDMERTAMTWLLHREGQDRMTGMAGLTEEAISEGVAALNKTDRLLGYVTYPPPAGGGPREGAVKGSVLEARIFQGRIDTGWTITSYSRMVKTAVHSDAKGEVEFPSTEPVPASAGRSVFTFPRGAGAGTCLHDIFEQLDFSGYSAEGLGEAVTRQLRKSGFEDDWAPVVCRWIEDVLQTPLDTDTGLRLRDLSGGDRLPEMGFYFAMRSFDLPRMKRVLADFGFDAVAERDEELKGLMRGYIDLVFRHRDRYFLADYKSNYLGPVREDYGSGELEKAMREHRYDLQYLIYTVAMHRYLTGRINGYGYTHHFGGVYYLFLRGMHPDHPPGSGVYHTVPPFELVELLDGCFGGMETR